MAVQFLLSGRAAVPKSKQIINLGRRSFRARVLYFGYSRRDELRATVSSEFDGRPCRNGSLQRSDDK